MKRITSLIIFFIASLATLIIFPMVALSEPIGTFTYIKGRVDITAPGMKAVPAHKGDDVNVGDIIRTKSKSKAEIALIDGSILRLAQKSRVKINEYMVEKEQTRGILKLFRGKIQNIVKKAAGRTFGRKTQHRYEVHTPTAVCGVRGTNLFVFYQANISGAIFKEGSGYGYSVNRPDEVKIIKAGQAMIVISPDQPPVIKPATDLEVEQHIEDTAPSEEEEEAEEEKEEKVEAVEEKVEAVEEAFADDIDLESLGGDIGEPVAIDTVLETLEPYIPPETPTEDITTFSGSFDGDTYRIIGGIVYEGAFERKTGSGEPYYDYDAHYDYEYFISNDDVLLFGERQEDYYESDDESGNIYLPDGRYFTSSKDPLHFRSDSIGEWDVISGLDDSGRTIDPTFFSDPPADGGTWERHGYEEWDSSCLATSGTFSGIMGGTGDLWRATDSNPAGISLMGMYKPADGDYNKPSIFGLGIQSSDITTGAYAGYLSGITDGMNGNIYAIYIDPSQYAGILKGDFSGDVYSGIETWKASGSIYPMTAKSISISAADLDNNLNFGIICGQVSGDFGAASGSKFFSYFGWGETLSIKGEDWGIYQLMFGYDNYSYNPELSTTLSAMAGGHGEFGTHAVNDGDPKGDTGIWLTSLMNGNLDNPSIGMLTADFSGKFLTYTKYGDLTGEIIGTYDTNSWQATAAGYWENSQDLQFNGVLGDWCLRRMVVEYNGHWDGDDGSQYYYDYYPNINKGWSYEKDVTENIETRINYNPDGTTWTWISTWEDGDEVLSCSYGAWSGDLYLDNLKIGSSLVEDVPQDPDPFCYIGHNGWIDGLMGGLDDLWTATEAEENQAEIHFIGECDVWDDGGATASVFTLGIESYNPYDDTWTILNQNDNSHNGAYYGYMGGRILEDNTLEGGILALYLDESGNMGFLKGDFDGNLYPDAEMWDAAGGIYAVEIVQGTGFNASDFHPDDGGLIRQIYLEGSAEFHGEFFDASTGLFGGDIYRRYAGKKRASVKTTNTLQIDGQFYDQYLFVASTIQGGTYTEFDGNTFDHWYLPFSFDDETTKRKGYLLSSSDAAGSWSDNLISGKGVGSWVKLEEVVTGVCGAELKGTFNPANATWQIAAMWAGMDTRTFLAMTATTGGQDKLAQLNIPCIEIGRTNLSGSGGNLTEVNMNDVTFFAYSTGAMPRIWATGDVDGSYSADPTGSTAVLSGNGFDNSVNFTVNNFDAVAVGGNWDASVNGSGTVSGHDINMNGAAAGSVDTMATFSGTGAGVASRPIE